MEVIFDRSFSKSIDKIKNKSVLNKIEKIIIQCEEAATIKDISNLKKMSGYRYYYPHKNR